MRHAGVALLSTVIALALAGSRGRAERPSRFVSLHDEVPSIEIEMRYLTAHNFIGRPIKGYRDPLCIVTRRPRRRCPVQVGAQQGIHAQGLRLLSASARRRRLRRLGQALERPADEGRVLPAGRQARLFKDGYIATKSGHSRGSTVDLTLVKPPPPAGALSPRRQAARLRRARAKRFPDNTVDMGTGYDCFDPLSHPSTPGSPASSARTGSPEPAMVRQGSGPARSGGTSR